MKTPDDWRAGPFAEHTVKPNSGRRSPTNVWPNGLYFRRFTHLAKQN